MPKIIKLDKHVAELIAAGEVIERPAAVIKELVENSIDAGANVITVEIRRGGTEYMRVSDNGCGINKEDVKTAFLRNATSKIKTADDLDSIITLGFRGEALASISAVSKVTLITRTKQENTGTQIKLEGGEVIDLHESGAHVGTSIIVKDLFYNTPARMKFLKKDVTEANAIASCMDRLALSHPEISFKFIRDGKTQLFSPGNADLLSCIYSVFGKEFANGLVKVKYDSNNVSVNGYVSKPENSRGSRGMQFFFVNNRFVKTVTAQSALEEAYKNEIMVHKFPSAVLFINIPENMLDVNTHPAKIEVRFVDEKSIYDSVYFSVKSALKKEYNPPKIDFNNKNQQIIMKNESMKLGEGKQLSFPSDTKINYNVSKSNSDKKYINHENQDNKIDVKNQPQNSVYDNNKSNFPNNISEFSNLEFNHPSSNTKEVDIDIALKNLLEDEKIEYKNNQSDIDLIEPNKKNDASEDKIKYKSELQFVGEVFSTYIVAQKDDNIYFIDKHAAHERIIFEELKKNRKNSYSQVLLEPVSVTLPKEEYNIILENSLELADAGIMVDDFGSGTILIREFPSDLDSSSIHSIIEEVASSLRKGKKEISSVFLDDLYHDIACKKAIKGNDKNSESELRKLIDVLEENNEIQHCPHGRPVCIVLEKKELEKRFGRI